VFCDNFVINGVEMLVGFGYDKVILYSKGQLVQYYAVLVC
jgi:hypothetical protein